MKKIISVLAILALACGGAVTSYAEENAAIGARVEVNGTMLDTEAMIVNDRTMIPLRAVSNALGCGVAWDADNRGITIYRATDGVSVPESVIVCWIDRSHAFRMDGYALGASTVMDAAPQIIDDRTYVPVRAVAELLGTQVDWNGDTMTAVITGTVTSGATDEFAEDLSYFEQEMLKKYDAYSDYVDGNPKTEMVEITLKDGGKIDVELYPELAPITVENFLKLAESDYYNGLIFHRVISGFMIQGGGMDGDGNMPKTEPIKGEFIANGVFNVIPHERGVISMARTSQNNSATGQFFIMHDDAPYLDGSYAAFGKVVSGIEYVDKIAGTQTDADDRPLTDCVIEKVEVVK